MFGFGKKNKSQQSQEGMASKLGQSIHGKIQNLNNFADYGLNWIKYNVSELIKKCQNLRDTNYRLGLKHLEKGNLSEAIFRFRFIKKFWPDHFDSYYQLAYSLILNKKPLQARIVLKDLLRQKPDYDQKAQDLLEHIDANLSENSDE